MPLPTQLELWASDTNYTATSNPTKVALSSARVAQGHAPNSSQIAAQEMNEYLHRAGSVLDEHRDMFQHLSKWVPAITGETEVDLPLNPLSGTYSVFLGTYGNPTNKMGLSLNAGDEVYWQIGHAQETGKYLKGFGVWYSGAGAEPIGNYPEVRLIYGLVILSSDDLLNCQSVTGTDSGAVAWPQSRSVIAEFSPPYPSMYNGVFQAKFDAKGSTYAHIFRVFAIYSDTDGT